MRFNQFTKPQIMSIFIEGVLTIISIDYSKVDNNLKEDFYIQILFQSQNSKA